MKTLRQSFGVELESTKNQGQILKVKETKGAIAGISKTESSSHGKLLPAAALVPSSLTKLPEAGNHQLWPALDRLEFSLSPPCTNTQHTHTLKFLQKSSKIGKGKKKQKLAKNWG